VEGPYGPYRQSERKHIYQAAADKLIAEGKAYRCFCTEEELDEKRLAAEAAGIDPKYDGKWRNADPHLIAEMLAQNAPYTVRFKVPPGKVVSIDDVVRGTVTWDADASLGDFIIMRSNGMPVYNFCVSVDDANMKITHVIRAEEHLTNTLRQMLILEALDCTPPTYAHCSLILGSDRSKLSKRHGATSLQQFSQQGFIPAAMMNYLANLGWNDGTPKEIYSPEDLVKAFDLSRIVKSAAVFDIAKLTWINAQHLRALSYDDIQPIVLQMMTQGDDAVLDTVMTENSKSEHWAHFLMIATKIAQRDMDLTVDTNRLLGYCFHYNAEQTLEKDEHAREILRAPNLTAFVDALSADYIDGVMPRGIEENFDELWKAYMKTLGGKLAVKGKALFHPVRFLLTGRMSGPDVGDQIKLLGLAQGIVKADYSFVPLEERIARIQKWSSARVDPAQS
jgi:glutamyl-tRNA synthetase